MSTVYTMTRTPDLLPGTLDLLILSTLQNSALHGWPISERIQQISREVLQINQGSLYPAAHPRLEHRLDRGRGDRVGLPQLAVEAREWERMANAIGRLMKFA